VGSTQYGATLYTDDVEQTIEGETIKFDENNLNDLQILCYYAYSDLYTGDTIERENLLGLEKCGSAIQLIIGKRTDYPADMNWGHARTEYESVIMCTDPPVPYDIVLDSEWIDKPFTEEIVWVGDIPKDGEMVISAGQSEILEVSSSTENQYAEGYMSFDLSNDGRELKILNAIASTASPNQAPGGCLTQTWADANSSLQLVYGTGYIIVRNNKAENLLLEVSWDFSGSVTNITFNRGGNSYRWSGSFTIYQQEQGSFVQGYGKEDFSTYSGYRYDLEQASGTYIFIVQPGINVFRLQMSHWADVGLRIYDPQDLGHLHEATMTGELTIRLKD
jgi:hypothetical protein